MRNRKTDEETYPMTCLTTIWTLSYAPAALFSLKRGEKIPESGLRIRPLFKGGKHAIPL